ncbi:MAG: hypothetical protein JXB00_19550 [Bacteroidales bacterium]|nr:hypothetical protein [Bacteroidales bacterium]
MILIKFSACFVYLLIFIFSTLRGQQNNIYPFDYSPRYQVKTWLAPFQTNMKSDNLQPAVFSPGLGGGADFLFYLVNTGRLKPAIAVGLNVCSYNSSCSVNYNDSLWTTDPGNDRVHIYEQARIIEKQKAVYVSVPLQLHLDYSVSKRMGCYLNAGYFFSVASSGSYNSEVLLSRQGYYPRYNVLIYDVDVEGSQYFYPTDKTMNASEPLRLRNNGGFIASAGFRYRVSPVYSVHLGFKSLTGRKNISGYNPGEEFLVVNNQHILNTTMAMNEIVKTTAWGVEFGLTMNLGKDKTQNIFRLLQKIRYSIKR